MAKKGQQVQLQVEINNDEEWEKLLKRDGLIVVDVYSDWCGPCAAMQANLKKIKLEIGGDFLHLAMAKADSVTTLKRFLGKSEPTWMFIAQKQMVQLVFGANAPILQRVILEELKKEKECVSGSRKRLQRTPETLSAEEQVQFDKLQALKEARHRVKADKLEKQVKDRKSAQVKNILDTMAHNGIILIFPHAASRGPEFIEQFIPESGLVVTKKEKPKLTEAALDDIEYFSPYKLPEKSRENLTSGDKGFAMMVTMGEDGHGPIDDKVLSFVYGSQKCPPGEKDSPADRFTQRPKVVAPAESVHIEESVVIGTQSSKSVKLASTPEISPEEALEEVEEEQAEPEPEPEVSEIYGVWAPANDHVKATALRHIFPLITAPLIIPEAEPIPPHVAVAYDAFKRIEVLKLIEEYPQDVMAFGFFTTEYYESAELIAKTKAVFEKTHAQTVYGEKLILKISKKRSESLLAFAQLGPTYISANVDEGEKECAIFFPDGYNDVQEVLEEAPKEKKKKKSKGQEEKKPHKETAEDEVIVFVENVIGEGSPEHFEMSEMPTIEDGAHPTEADKSTSPMMEEVSQIEDVSHPEAPAE